MLIITYELTSDQLNTLIYEATTKPDRFKSSIDYYI